MIEFTAFLYFHVKLLNIHFNYLSDSLGKIGNVITIKKIKYEFLGLCTHTHTLMKDGGLEGKSLRSQRNAFS